MMIDWQRRNLSGELYSAASNKLLSLFKWEEGRERKFKSKGLMLIQISVLKYDYIIEYDHRGYIFSECTSHHSRTGAHDLCWTHHDGLGQAVVWRADGAQGTSEQPPLSGRDGGRGKGQAVQLCVGASPERPVDQRPLPLKRLLLTGLCRRKSCGR